MLGLEVREMPTKKRSIEVEIQEAPSTPLSLKFGVIYSPRAVSDFGGGDFAGYSCVETDPGWFVVAGWGDGRTAALWEGDNPLAAYHELGRLLRMDR
jgi:hypothetical protein